MPDRGLSTHIYMCLGRINDITGRGTRRTAHVRGRLDVNDYLTIPERGEGEEKYDAKIENMFV